MSVRHLIGPAMLALLSACAAEQDRPRSPPEAVKVAASGKVDVPLGEVPREVLAAAASAQPGFVPGEAEAETRDGRRYFDLGGTMPDGSEIEFDVVEQDGRWRVVEIQRDIPFDAVPPAVRQASAAHDSSLRPTRVIESRQVDGALTIYELFAPAAGNPQGRKVEIKWDGRKAEVLAREWAH